MCYCVVLPCIVRYCMVMSCWPRRHLLTKLSNLVLIPDMIYIYVFVQNIPPPTKKLKMQLTIKHSYFSLEPTLLTFSLWQSLPCGPARLINLSWAKCPPSSHDGHICPQAYFIFVVEHIWYVKISYLFPPKISVIFIVGLKQQVWYWVNLKCSTFFS